MKNDQQAIQIVHQKKTILELKNLMAKYDNTSIDFSPEDSTILNATSPVKPSQGHLQKTFFYIKTTYKPGVPGTRKKQQPTTKKKKTTTCRATTIPSHNNC